MGLVRSLLAQPPEPRHRFGWMGQGRQGESSGFSSRAVRYVSGTWLSLIDSARPLGAPRCFSHDDFTTCVLYLLLQRDHLFL